jgi:hypothetical protein
MYLNPQDQSMYQKLASDYADRVLNRVVETPGYQNAADPMKRYILEEYMKKARSYATKEMFAYKMRDPEYRAQYIIEQRKKRGLEE